MAHLPGDDACAPELISLCPDRRWGGILSAPLPQPEHAARCASVIPCDGSGSLLADEGTPNRQWARTGPGLAASPTCLQDRVLRWQG